MTEPAEIGKRDIEGFIEYMIATRTASTTNVTYRALQQWFKWMLAEEEIERSPMERTTCHAPQTPAHGRSVAAPEPRVRPSFRYRATGLAFRA